VVHLQLAQEARRRAVGTLPVYGHVELQVAEVGRVEEPELVLGAHQLETHRAAATAATTTTAAASASAAAAASAAASAAAARRA